MKAKPMSNEALSATAPSPDPPGFSPGALSALRSRGFLTIDPALPHHVEECVFRMLNAALKAGIGPPEGAVEAPTPPPVAQATPRPSPPTPPRDPSSRGNRAH